MTVYQQFKRMIPMRLFVSSLALILLLAAPAVAQEKEAPREEVKKETPVKEAPKKDVKKEAAKKTEPKKEVAKKEEPVQSVLKKDEEATPITKWIDAENALIDPLSDKDKESFFILRNKYSVIRVINVVKRDVGAAVKSCGEKNPDMKDKMDKRFGEWKSAVEPIIDTAKKTLEKDLNAQKIVDVKKAKEVLKLNDEAFEFGESKITKTPVTTKEACNDLVASMDRTEDEMIKLLQETLLPESVIKKRSDAAKKEEPSKKAE